MTSKLLLTAAAFAVILPVSAQAADSAKTMRDQKPQHQMERAELREHQTDPRLSATEEHGVSALSDNEASSFNNVAPASGDEMDEDPSSSDSKTE